MTLKKHDIIIVGAGLFGCVAARLAQENGHRVTVIDDARPFRASPAAGCVIAPSWVTAIPKDKVGVGMTLLDELYGLQPLEFAANLGTKFKAHRVRTSAVLKLPDSVERIKGKAVKVGPGIVWVTLNGEPADAVPLRGKVLLCTGIWGQELTPIMPAIQGLYGASLLVSGNIAQPRLSVYAPYRQAVAFNMDTKHVWFGDGTALVERTWKKESDKRVIDTVKRMTNLTGIHTDVRSLRPQIGARPYIKGHMGYFAKVNTDVWASNGGAKNGIILAAIQAEQFMKELS